MELYTLLTACDIDDSLACLSSSACPAGSFGDGCRGVCGCRDVSECDAIAGHCTCQPGYTETTCHDECPEGFYGQSCSSECDCSSNGTVSCNNVNGTCDCRDNWMGDQCEIESMYVCNIAYRIFITKIQSFCSGLATASYSLKMKQNFPQCMVGYRY